MGKRFLGLFGKKKSKKNLPSAEPPNKKASSKPASASASPAPSLPQHKEEYDNTTVQGSSILTEESNSLRSSGGGGGGGASSSANHHSSTLNVIAQAPEEFQEAADVPRKQNIVDLDESLNDDDEDSDEMSTTKDGEDDVTEGDQGIFDTLGDDDDDNYAVDEPSYTSYNSGDEQMSDTSPQEDIPEEDRQEQEDDIMMEDIQEENDEQDFAPDVVMSNAEAAEYYDYGDAAPTTTGPLDYEEGTDDEDKNLSVADEHNAPIDADAAAHYDYGDGAPSSHNYDDDDEDDEDKVISANENDASKDADAAALYGYGDAAPSVANQNDDDDEPNTTGEQVVIDQTNDAAYYGYGDAAPTVGPRNEEESHQSSQQEGGPVQIPPITPSSPEPGVSDTTITTTSEATNLYQAKRLRLKQRRMSMSAIQQRTERAAARQNKLLLKKLLKKEMSDEDDYIQTHLGCDDKGKCLRHPNMTIVGKVQDFRFKSVSSCKICHSEQKAGGIARQRKSMSMVIGDIKQMQKDRKSWRLRTKVLHHGKEIDSDEDSYEGSRDTDSSKSLDSLENITGFFAEGEDELELGRRDHAWKEKVSGRVAQVRAWDGKAALKCNPVFAKYFRMVSLGVPKDAVKQACEFDGWDPRVMDLDPNRPLLDQLYSTRGWKKSEKEDLLLNIRLCMGQESTDEQAGDRLLEITDNIFDAYCKKKESIVLHRKQMKREEEAQKWIGSGQTLLKKTSFRRPDAAKEEAKEKKDDDVEPKSMSTALEQTEENADEEPEAEPEAEEQEIGMNELEEPIEPQQLEQIEDLNKSLASIGELSEREEDESESNFDVDHPIPSVPVAETESPIAEEAENQGGNIEGQERNEPLVPPSDVDEQADVSGVNDKELNSEAKDTLIESEPKVSPASDESNLESWSDEADGADFIMPLEGGGGKIRDAPSEKSKSIDSEAMYSVAGDEATTDDEMIVEGGGKIRDEPKEKSKSIDSSALYSVAGDGATTDDEMDEDALKMAFGESQSLPSIGEIYDEWDAEDGIAEDGIAEDGVAEDGVVVEEPRHEEGAIEGPRDEDGVEDGAIEGSMDEDAAVEGSRDGEDGVIEGPIEIPSIRPSLEDDNMSMYSDMTGESWKKSKRSSKRKQRKEMESAHRSLEKKDVIVASLVAKVERLRQQVADQNKNGSGDARSLAEELRVTKRLIAEKDIISAGLDKRIQQQEREANEQWRIVEEQTIQIMRLKEKVGSEEGAIAPESKKESSSSKVTRSSSKNKTSSSKKKKSSSSSKDKKRSSKDSKSRSKSKSSKKSKRKENLDRAHLREVFKKTVRKLIIITRSFLHNDTFDKEMSVDRKSFRRSSMRMDAWVAPTEWNDFLSDDEDDCKPKSPKPPPSSKSPSPRPAMHKSMSLEPVRARSAMMTQQRGAASVLLSNKDRIPRQKIQWSDDDDICKVIFVERIPDDVKKELFYTGEDYKLFRLDKFMEDHEDEFELVEEDDSDYSEEWIEEEYSGDEEEIEYIDEEVVSDEEGSYIEEEIVTDDEYSIEEEAPPVQQNRRRSLF